jgi:outer membrane protein TolC
LLILNLNCKNEVIYSYALYNRNENDCKIMLKLISIAFLPLVLSMAKVSAQPLSLDYFLEQGLKNSPMLRDYTNQLNSGRLDSLLVLCGYKPQVGITSQVLVSPAGTHFGYDEAITNGGNYAATIGVKQPLFNKNIKSAQIQNIQLLQQSLDVNKSITETELKNSVTMQYIAAYYDYSQMQFLQRVVDILSDQAQEVKYLVENGIYQQTDLMNLLVSKKAQEISQKQVLIQYKNDIALLNLLCGIVDTSYVVLAKPEIKFTKPVEFSSLPAVVQSKIDSLKNSNARTLIDLNYRPKLEAFADAGFMAIKPVNIPNNFGTSFGLNFSLPIYDGKQRLQEYKKIDISENSRRLYLNFYTSQYRQQYNQFQEQIRLTDDLILDMKTQLEQQKQVIDMYKVEIEHGLVRFTDYLLIVNNYIITQNNLAAVEMNRLQLINQLNYLK